MLQEIHRKSETISLVAKVIFGNNVGIRCILTYLTSHFRLADEYNYIRIQVMCTAWLRMAYSAKDV
jgi:hypothetical protein